jgi:hypothetical protein
MNKLITVALSAIFATGVALAQAPGANFARPVDAPAKAAAGDCEAKAVSKDGKPLAGAAKTAFMKKCEGDGKPAEAKKDSGCEAKAVSKDGKPLAGAAKTAFMKKCEADAK